MAGRPRTLKSLKFSGIEGGISQIAESGAVPVIGSGLCDHIDLAARLGSILGVIQGAADAIFFDRVLGDLQPGLRFLGLLLNAASIDAINLEVIVVTSSSGEADGPLVAAAIVLREGCEQGEAGPVAPVIGEFFDLCRINYR